MSPFIQLAHENYLAVHPYTQQDDIPVLTDTAHGDIQKFIIAGVDGLTVDFPHSAYNLFSLLGSRAYFPETPPEPVDSSVKL